MGMVRFLLALSVVIAHTPWRNVMTGGPTSVQAFFAISGFYMALVLDRNPKYQRWHIFYMSRLQRLFPLYWIVAGMTALAFWLIGNNFYGDLSAWGGLPINAKCLLVFSNLTIVLQDLVLFLGVNGGGLILVGSGFNDSEPPLYHFLLVVPAWSIAIELVFYSIAPWLVRQSSRTLGLLCMTSLLLRGTAAWLGYSADPWSYRFWPFEVALFLLGILAYRRFRQSPDVRRPWAVPLVVVLTVGFPWIAFQHGLGVVLYLTVVVWLLPALFQESRASATDKFLGDLTYPLYVVHSLSLAVIFYAFQKAGLDYKEHYWISIIGVPLTVLPAFLLHVWCVEPLERFRTNRTQPMGTRAA